MSNPTTYYNVGGIDLSNIFQPYSSGALARATGYRILGGQDLNQIFAPLSASWVITSAPSSQLWYSIASSSDGTKLAAVVYGGYIWTYK